MSLPSSAHRPMTLVDVFESLQSTMATDARDWSQNPRDAWLYGIVCGWGDALTEVANQHGWSSDTVWRLIRLHNQVVSKPPL